MDVVRCYADGWRLGLLTRKTKKNMVIVTGMPPRPRRVPMADMRFVQVLDQVPARRVVRLMRDRARRFYGSMARAPKNLKSELKGN